MTFEEFYRLLEKNPDDWELRVVFADFLEDEGRCFLSWGQRVQVLLGVCPIRRSEEGGQWEGYWQWWVEAGVGCGEGCKVPQLVWWSMPRAPFTEVWCKDLSVVEGVFAEGVLKAIQHHPRREDWLLGSVDSLAWPVSRHLMWWKVLTACPLPPVGGTDTLVKR